NWSGHPSAKICHELSDGFVSLWVLAHFCEERGWNGHDVCSGTDGLVNVHEEADVARTRIQGHQSLVERHSASRINGDTTVSESSDNSKFFPPDRNLDCE